jgi:hypothetical protein
MICANALDQHGVLYRALGRRSVEPRAIAAGQDLKNAAHPMHGNFGLPRGLLLASSLSFEGAVRFLKTVPLDELQLCAIGSYDWNPFAGCVKFLVDMVRRDVDGLLAAAFRIIDESETAQDQLLPDF